MRLPPRWLANRQSGFRKLVSRSSHRRSVSVVAAIALTIGGLGSMAGASVLGEPLPSSQAGSVLTWGGPSTANGAAARGHGEEIGQPTVTVGKEWVGAWGTGNYALALASDGSMVGWGNSAQSAIWGQIPSSLGNISSVATGTNVALAVRADGTLQGWGNNSTGGLPVPTVAQTNVTKAAAGQRIHAVLLRDGTVRAWGASLANATQVPTGLSDVVDIAAVGDGIYALKADGGVVGWGNVQDGVPAEPVAGAERLALAGSQLLSINTDGTATLIGGASTGRKIDIGERILDVSGGSASALRVLGASGKLYNVNGGTGVVTPNADMSGQKVNAIIGTSGRNIAIASDEPIGEEVTVTRDPVVNGLPVMNETVSLTPAEFSRAPEGEVRTQWYRVPAADGADPVAIDGATATELTLPPATFGQRVFATQTAEFDGEPVVATSERVGPVEPKLAPGPRDNQKTQITGDPEIGAELSISRAATFTGPAASTLTRSYQWFADGEPINGATSATFAVTADQAGASITVRETATSPVGQTATQDASNAVGPIPAAPVTVKKEPTINGNAWLDQTVTLSPAEFSRAPEGEVVTQWYRVATTEGAEPEAISGANGTELKLGSATLLRQVFATQTAEFDGVPVVATSQRIGPVEPTLSAGPRENQKTLIAGDAEVGAELTITRPAGFTGPPSASLTRTYQWFADGESIEGATGSTFTVTGEQAGTSITVRETATTAAGQTASQDPSNAIGPIPVPPVEATAPPVISGTAKVGETLTGTPATFNATDGVTVSNQWLADGDVIEGATGTTLELTEAQQGADISFRSTAVRGEEDPVVSTSETVGPVLRADIAIGVGTPPSISGTAKVGQTLTGTGGTFTGDTEGQPTHQWLADGQPINGATSLTLELGDAQAGKVITLRSTQAGAGGPLSSTSEPTSAVQARLAATAKPTIKGTARVGQTLTATPAAFSGSPDAITGQWLADGEPLEGQTGTGLVLTEDHEGAVITYASTATRAGDDPVTSVSDATRAVTPADAGGGDGDGDGDGGGDTPTPPDAEDLRGAIEILGDGPFRPGDTITVKVGDDYVGQEVSAWMFSEPRNLGTVTVASNGTIRVAIPHDAELGEHTLAVYDADGNLIGFDTLTLASADGAGGGLGGVIDRVLPDTGSPASLAVWSLGLVMLLAGLAVLLVPAALRRRTPAS